MSDQQPLLPNQEQQAEPRIKSNIFTLYWFASKSTITLFTTASLLAVYYAQCLPVFSVALGEMLEGFEEHTNEGMVQKKASKVAIFLYIFAATIFITQAIGMTFYIIVGRRQSHEWKSQYFNKVIRMPVTYFDKRNPTSLSSKIEYHATNIEDASGLKMGVAIFLIIWMISGFIYGFCYYNQMFWIWIGLVPVFWGIMALGHWLSYSTIKQRDEAYENASQVSGESFEGIKTIAAFNQQGQVTERYDKELEGDAAIINRLALVQGLSWSSTTGIILFMSGLSFYIQSKHIEDGDENWFSGHNIQADDIMVFMISLCVGVMNGGLLVPIVHFVSQGIASVSSMREVTDEPIVDESGGEVVENMQGRIEFKNVVFSYPTNPNSKALNDVSFVCEEHKFTGLVGETGSGKSTVMQLIERFYLPNSGQILIDGKDLKNLDIKKYRSQVCYVPQEPILFSDSIRENIKLGNANITDDDIKEACRKAQAKFVLDGKSGINLDTNVGQKGSQLSGGQKQRIAIARLFLNHYSLIILDEATSALDVKTESKVVAEIQKSFRGVTTIAIAQRLSTVTQADHIYVFQMGKMIEQGTHRDMFNAGQYYYRIANAQNLTADSGDARAAQEQQTEEEKQEKDETIPEIAAPVPDVMPMKVIIGIFMELKKYWLYFMLAFNCAVVAGIVFTVYGYLNAQNIHILLISNDKESKTSHRMWIYLGLGVALIVSFTMLFYLTAIVGGKFTKDLRHKCMDAIVHQDMEFFDRNNSGELSAKLGRDCRQASNLGGTVMSVQFLSTTCSVSGIIFASLYDSVLALIFLGYAPLVTFTMLAAEHVKTSHPTTHKSTEQLVGDTLTNIRAVKALQLEDQFAKEFQSRCDEQNAQLVPNSAISGSLMASFNAVIVAVQATLYLVGTNRVEADKVTGLDYLVAIFVLLATSWFYYICAPILSDAVIAIGSLQNLVGLFMFAPKIKEQDDALVDEIKGSVEFQNVLFSYPTRNVQVLNGLSFKLEQGKSLGVCGTTGSGKSTIVQLLLRFYAPTSGQILIDGVEIEKYKLSHLRENIAWIGQEPLLFKGSIEYNIKVGNRDATKDEVEKAARDAQCYKSLMDQNKDFDYDVGYRGQALSGGQKQRVAIARAIIKKASILLMDEATSALDGATEQEVKDALDVKQITKIIVAHRISTLHSCDYILVMELGQQVEFDKRDTLFNNPRSYYRQLYDASVGQGNGEGQRGNSESSSDSQG